MSQNLSTAVAVIGIDIGKNSFHVVGLDEGDNSERGNPNTYGTTGKGR